MNKKVMVFMPCYNCEKYIGQAIESVLRQSYQDFELVILDDGSQDNSMEIVKNYAERDVRIRIYENEKNQGIAFTRNRGLDLCQCDYLGLMDADDITVPERLEQEITFLEEHPDIVVVGGRYQQMSECGELLERKLEPVQSDSAIRAHMLFHNVIANGSVLMRKECIDKHGIRYRQQYQSAEDYRFWCEVLNIGKMHNIDKIFQYYRIHEDSLEQIATKRYSQNRYCGIMEIKKYLLSMQGYVLPDKDIDFFSQVLAENKSKLNYRERKDFKRILNQLQEQVMRQDEIYQQEFDKCLEYYRTFTENKIKRKIKRIGSLLRDK